MSDQTVRGHLRNARATFYWAMKVAKVGGARDNPFTDFECKPLPTNDHAYVALDRFETILAKIGDPGERAFCGLCRLAGLRRGEAIGLPWSGRSTDSEGREHGIGVDRKRRRLCLVGTHKGQRGRRYREVPVEPRLAELLAAALEARPSVGLGVSVCGLSGNNLHKRAEAYCEAAGVQKWPGFFQAMRSSRENDWKADGIAEPTYTAWLGHSAAVSRQHYVAPTDAEFERVTRVA